MHVLHLYRPALPSTRAQSIQVLGTCHGLAQLGCHVTLLGQGDADIDEVLAAHHLPPVDGLELQLGPKDNPALAGWWFRGQVAAWLHRTRGQRRVVYARAKRYAAQLGSLPVKVPLVLEAHEVDSAQAREAGRAHEELEALERRVLGRAAAVVTNCRGTLELLERTHAGGLPDLRVPVHNATAAVRARAHEPTSPPVLGYAGSLRAYKGQDTLLEAVQVLEGELRVELLGGTDDERARLEGRGVRLAGEIAYREVPDRIASWAGGLLPLDDDLFGRHLCNPLKLWDYLAVGLPLVAADLPSLREVLGDADAAWFAPGDVDSLVTAMRAVARGEQPGVRRLRTWRDRAREVLHVLEAVA